MHSHSLDRWAHAHNFNTQAGEGERRTKLVVLLTTVMMVVGSLQATCTAPWPCWRMAGIWVPMWLTEHNPVHLQLRTAACG